MQIKDMEYRLTLTAEEQRSSSKGKLMSQNTLTKLDEALARNRELENQLKEVTSERTLLLSKNGMLKRSSHTCKKNCIHLATNSTGTLKELNRDLEGKVEALETELQTKTDWYEPKIEQVRGEIKL